MAYPVRILPHYTYHDYCKWEGQWELIEGIPHAMRPAPVPRHQIIASTLSYVFMDAMKGCKNCKTSQPLDYKIAENTIVQPDFIIFCDKITKPYLDFAPCPCS